MSHKFSLSLVALATASLMSPVVLAEQDSNKFESITIIGSKAAVNTIPGSGNYISKEELEKFQYSDIMRVLAATPGV